MTGAADRLRAVAARVITVLAILIVWFALIFPDQLSRLTPGALLRLPVEALLLVALGLVLPGQPRAGWWRRSSASHSACWRSSRSSTWASSRCSVSRSTR